MAFIEIDDHAREIIKERARKENETKPKQKIVPVEWFKIQAGEEATIRILPPWTADGFYAYSPYVQYNQHWNVGDKNGRVICPVKTAHSEDKRCYVCEQISALFDANSDDPKAKKMYAGKNFIYQIIDRADAIWDQYDPKIENHPELANSPKIKFMRMSFTGHRYITDIVSDAEYGNITSVSSGRDITIKRRGTGLNTEYTILPKPKQTSLFDDPSLIEATAGLLSNLEEHPFFRIPTYDETRAIYLGEEIKKNNSSEPAYGKQANSKKIHDFSQWVAFTKAPLEKEQLASKMNWTLEQIPPCYGQEPDHTDSDCTNCPINGYCIAKYKQLSDKFSTKESADEIPF